MDKLKKPFAMEKKDLVHEYGYCKLSEQKSKLTR